MSKQAPGRGSQKSVGQSLSLHQPEHGEYSLFFVILPCVLQMLLVWTVKCARTGKLKEQEDQQLRGRTSCALCWSQTQQGNLPERSKVWQYTVFRSNTHYETGLDINIYACCVLFDGQAVCFGMVRKAPTKKLGAGLTLILSFVVICIMSTTQCLLTNPLLAF